MVGTDLSRICGKSERREKKRIFNIQLPMFIQHDYCATCVCATHSVSQPHIHTQKFMIIDFCS